MLHAIYFLELIGDALHPDLLLLNSADWMTLLILGYAGKGGLRLHPQLLLLTQLDVLTAPNLMSAMQAAELGESEGLK